ncbi:hypothetical protein G7046_g4816 [Stylonectria norvegica]|nr:hypothetical protein G7046_g4816 [Stylonectria norvegica]
MRFCHYQSPSMVGLTLHGAPDYHVQSLEVRDTDLEVYVVTDARGDRYEAQAFACELPRQHEGLYQARRRRIKRIFRSKNFEQEIEQAGRRFLISRVQRNVKEWRDLQNQVKVPGERTVEGEGWLAEE